MFQHMPARISLTISGAIALGAYEGGALAALLYAIRPLAAGDDPAVVIDVMSGASAGSITALLAARALQQGHDPEQVMAGAWVKKDRLGDLLAHNTDAPLSIASLRALGQTLLDPPGTPDPNRQLTKIQLSYTIASLRGLEYQLARLGRAPVPSVTYVDYFDHVLEPATTTDALVGKGGKQTTAKWPLDAALASAANAMGFPPYLLDRTAQWQAYVNEGVDNLPPGKQMWYTDGGTIDNEPLGRTLDLTNRVDEGAGDDRRLHLLIHPHPTAATSASHWADPKLQPSFAQTAIRAFGLQRAQSLYRDLKQAEKTNSHIAWVESMIARLGPELDALPDANRARVATALRDTLNEITAAKAAFGGARSGPPASPTGASPSDLLDQVARAASGTGGKRAARIDVISPLLLPEVADGSHTVEQMLSGEILFHFGGFLDETMRRNDFDLGYRSTLEWLKSDGLAELGLPKADTKRAVAAAQKAYKPGNGWTETGGTTVGGVMLHHPWVTARLAAQLAKVLIHDLFHHPQP